MTLGMSRKSVHDWWFRHVWAMSLSNRQNIMSYFLIKG